MATTPGPTGKVKGPRGEKRKSGFVSHQKIGLAFTLVITDVFIVVGLAVLLHLVRNKTAELTAQYWAVVAFGTTLFSYITLLQRGYDFEWLRHGREQMRLAGISAAVMFIVVIAVLFFSKASEELSRIWLVSWSITTATVIGAERLLVSRFLAVRRRSGAFATNVAIVGRDDAPHDLASRLIDRCSSDANFCGWFSIAPNQPEAGWGSGRVVGGDYASGSIDDLIAISRRVPLDEVIVVVPDQSGPAVEDTLQKLSSIPVSVGIYPEALLQHSFPSRGVRMVAGLPVVDLFRRPLAGAEFFLKRSMDVVISAAMLILIFPFMGIIALLIKIDSEGPIFFKQKRLGFNNNVISVYKFRTMRHDACLDLAAPQATRRDSRVTRVGRVLRSTSLDELPQLLNVLRGGMSLVGPRPHALEHNERYAREIDRYLARHRVKPGITGFAQVNGLRGETRDPRKMEMRVEYDLHYIENWSLLLDLQILFKTLFVGFRHPNAF